MSTSLTLAWHITKKDLRGSRDLIVMWVLLAIVHTLLRMVWPPLTMRIDPEWIERVNLLQSIVPSWRTLVFALLVAQLVHADPLTTADAFWLTRPISRTTLFVSKLGTMLLVIGGPSVVAQVVPMFAYGVPPLDVARLLCEHLLYFAPGLMVALVAAALTWNWRSFAALTLPVLALWLGASILISSAAAERRIADGPRVVRHHEPESLTAASRQLVTLVLITAGFGAAAWRQYRTRRRERSALIVAITVTAALVTPYLIPAGLEGRASMTENPAVPLGQGVRFQDGPRTIVMWSAGDRDGQCGVMMRVTQVQGMQSALSYPVPAYRFVHRSLRKSLVFTYFALPFRDRELAPSQRLTGTEQFELFQVLYRYAVVGPVFESNDPRAELKSVSCRDVDVVVRH